jgi:hypothetical protein
MGTILAEEGTLFAFLRKLLGVGHFLVVGPGEKLGRVDLVIDFIGGVLGILSGVESPDGGRLSPAAVQVFNRH